MDNRVSLEYEDAEVGNPGTHRIDQILTAIILALRKLKWGAIEQSPNLSMERHTRSQLSIQ
jgi:hypothetical protein